MRYILLDRITHVELGKVARGVKCVTLTDEVLHDHFPDHPVLPGALVVEAAAQLAGYLLEATVHVPGTTPLRAVLGQIDKAKFSRPAEPGDTLELEARVAQLLDGAGRMDIEASIRGERALRGSLTFLLRNVASERVHEQRRYLYRLWTKGLAEAVIP
jgi:3-hydroxyacyl-[acyl-carrier-protein] dehydratase